MSPVFYEVASSITREQDNEVAAFDIVGYLKKKFLERMISKCSIDGKAKKTLESIAKLYTHDASSIQIIGNHQLNNHLETLAVVLSPYVSRVNDHVTDAIIQAFSTD